MASVVLRRQVTSILQKQGPVGAQQEVQITKELVPHKHEMLTAVHVSSPQQIAEALHAIQRNVDDSTRSARSLPVLGGGYWPDQALSFNVSFIINHGVDGKVSLLACRVRPAYASWKASTAYLASTPSVPVQVVPLAHTTGFWYACSGAGTSGNAEPASWPVIVGQTLPDNGVTWTCMGPIAPVVYEVSQDTTNGRMTLRASGPCVADLWFYPSPEASK